MEVVNTILTVIQVLLAIVIILAVMFQSSKSSGMSGALTGGAETFFGKNKGKSMDALLNKITIGCSIAFAVLAILINVIQ